MLEKAELGGLIQEAVRASTKNLRIPSEEFKCLDLLKQIKDLSLSPDSLLNSESIHKMQLLTNHKNPRIQSEAKSLFDIWLRTIYGRGRHCSFSMGNEKAARYPQKKTNRKSPLREKSEAIHQIGQKMAVAKSEAMDLFDTAIKVAYDVKSRAVKINSPEISGCVDALNRLSRMPRGRKQIVKEPPKSIPAASVASPESFRKFESSSLVGDTESCAERRVRSKVPKLGNTRSQLTSRIPIRRASSEKSRRTAAETSSRSKLREILSRGLAMVADEVPEQWLIGRDPVNVAAAVESVMFQKLGSFYGPNKTKYRSIIFNISDANNKDLRKKVILGEIKPEKLVEMRGEELGSEKRQMEIRRLRQKAAERDNASFNQR